MVAPVTLEMPYAFKLLAQELETYMNIGMRIMTEKDLLVLDGLSKSDLPAIEVTGSELAGKEERALPALILPEASVPEYREEKEGPLEASPELLMKLGALPKEVPLVSSGLDVVVDGTGVQGSIAAAAAAANAMAAASPGVVPGSLVQTEEGQVFQPSPTTVTVLPPARSINVVPGSEAEGVTADEDLLAQGQPQQEQRLQQPQQQQPQPPFLQQGGAHNMMHNQPYAMMPPYGMSPPPYGYPQMPYGYPGLNMGQAPAIYANSIPQPAQIFTSGVPGAPPTISVQTDSGSMANYAMPQGPRPNRAGTMKRRAQMPFGSSSGSTSGSTSSEIQSGGGANITVTVNKMN